MQTIIFLFAILTTPTDRIICDLWTRELSQEAFNAACPIVTLAGYRLDVYSLDMQLQCSKPAESLPRILQDCNLNAALDNYILRIVQPNFSELLCMVESENETSPTDEEVIAQCPNVEKSYQVQYAGTKQEDEAVEFACPARDIPSGFGLYEQVSTADELVTRDELALLAGNLIWFGHVKVTSCEGRSGVNMNRVATPCGYLSAHDDVLAWQNQFNASIYEASITYSVPARLLKRMMMMESQFWLFYDNGLDGEFGLMQITDNGLDTLHRFDFGLDPDYLSRDETEKSWSRNVTRQLLLCDFCSLQEAIDHTKNIMPYYARLLASFHCRAVTINPSLVGIDGWRQTVVDYNGSFAYLERIEQ